MILVVRDPSVLSLRTAATKRATIVLEANKKVIVIVLRRKTDGTNKEFANTVVPSSRETVPISSITAHWHCGSDGSATSCSLRTNAVYPVSRPVKFDYVSSPGIGSG
eukprot:845616-Rhodomonas_salina.1